MATPSSLLALPRELRDHIYETLLYQEHEHVGMRVRTSTPAQDRPLFCSYSDIILVCRQVHDEYFEAVEQFAVDKVERGRRGDCHFDNVFVTITDFHIEDVVPIYARLSALGLLQDANVRIELAFTGTVDTIALERRLAIWRAQCKKLGVEECYIYVDADGPEEVLEALFERIPDDLDQCHYAYNSLGGVLARRLDSSWPRCRWDRH